MPRMGFGVEIEAVARPRMGNVRQTAAGYRIQLAQHLRRAGLDALADNGRPPHRRHPEHYDRWFITFDVSLRRLLEVVSTNHSH